ncbi:hypothetical protein [Natronobiforma cellulositropha]|nr:hypothetical protein [Natronobiforma cellulositropha]
MVSHTKRSAQTYTCPECTGKLIVSSVTTECSDCTYIPGYGAR